MADQTRTFKIDPLGPGARVANLCTARTGSSSVTSRLRHLFVDEKSPLADMVNWMDKRISRHSFGTEKAFTHHDHRLTVRDLESLGACHIVATIRHPADRIESGHRRRVDGRHNNHPPKAKIAHLGNQRNQKKASNIAYLKHFGENVNKLVKHLQRPGFSQEIAEAVGETLSAESRISASNCGQWWLKPIVEGYLNGKNKNTRIYWLRCEHLNQDWNALLRLFKQSSYFPISASNRASSLRTLNTSSSSSRIAAGGALNEESLSCVSKMYARDLELWGLANKVADGKNLLVTDGAGCPITTFNKLEVPRCLKACEDIVVVAVSNNHLHPNVALLRGTCPFPLIYDAFPHGGHWKSNREKLKATLEVARRLDPFNILCHVDAFDVVLSPEFRNLPGVFSEFLKRDHCLSRHGTRVLVSAVRARPFPTDGVLSPYINQSTAAPRSKAGTMLSDILSQAGYPCNPKDCDWNVYANSGAYIGYAKDVVKMLELMLEIAGGTFDPVIDGTRAGNSDQELFHAALLTSEGRGLMCLDSKSVLFCNLGPRPESQIVPRAWTKEKPWEVCRLKVHHDDSSNVLHWRSLHGGPVFDFSSAGTSGFLRNSFCLELPEFRISVNKPARIEFRQASKYPQSQYPVLIHGNGGPETSAKRAFSEVFVPAVEQMLLQEDEGAYGKGARKRWVRAALDAKENLADFSMKKIEEKNSALGDEIKTCDPVLLLGDGRQSLYTRRNAIKQLMREGRKRDILNCLQKGAVQDNILLGLEVAHQLGPMSEEQHVQAQPNEEMSAWILFASFRRLGAAIRLLEAEQQGCQHQVAEIYQSPDFLILGAPKCGTTSLVQYLLRVPGIQFSSRHGGSVDGSEDNIFDPGTHDPMEVHVFDRTHGCSDFARFRLAAMSMHLHTSHVKNIDHSWCRTGHSTPLYLHHEEAPQNALSIMSKQTCSKLRFVIMTRDPVQRTISSWRFKRRTGEETRSFSEAVREGMRHPMSYRPRSLRHVGISMYHHHIARWKKAFPNQEGAQSRFHICRLEDLSHDPHRALHRILVFLGASVEHADAALAENVHLEKVLRKRFNTAAPFKDRFNQNEDMCLDHEAALNELNWFFSSSELVRLVNPNMKTHTLVVTFGGMHGNFGGIMPFEFSSFMKKSKILRCVDQMFYVDKAQRHYLSGIDQISSNVAETAMYLASKICGYKNIIFVGTSAGGYAAILFGSLLQVSSVLAFVPQTILEGSKQTEISVSVDPKYRDLKPFLNTHTNYELYSWHKNLYEGNHGRHHCDHLVGPENVRVEFVEQNVKEMRDSGRLESIFSSVVIT